MTQYGDTQIVAHNRYNLKHEFGSCFAGRVYRVAQDVVHLMGMLHSWKVALKLAASLSVDTDLYNT